MKSKIDFVNGKTGSSLLRMVLPLLGAMLLTMAYNLVDSLWVGNLLGENGYAALTNSTAVVLILNAIAMGAGNGIAILISQTVGAGRAKEAEEMTATALLMSAGFAVGVTAILEIFLRSILGAMQTPAQLFEAAYAYLSVYLLGYVAIYLYMQFTAIFRAYGDPIFQMKGMLYSTLLNAVLDPLMIHVWGLRGAAWATVASEVFCLLFAFVYHRRKKLIPAALLFVHGGFGLNGIWTAILLSHIAAALFAGITAAKTARMQSTKA